MPVSITLYNHTVSRFASGANAVGDTYKINLYSVFDFDATDTTKALAEGGATQLATQYGYTQDDKALADVAVDIVSTNDAKFSAGNVSWTANLGDIGPASYAMIYNDTDTNKPPVAYIAFGEAKTANTGTPFNITWHSDGIITFTYTSA
jgi:hypothetical protein